MTRKTGKVIYCPKCYRDWGENQSFPDIVHCEGCRATIEELKEVKTKRLSRSISGPPPKKGKR